MKCEICKNTIEELFLGKIKGTFIQEPGKKKFHSICFDCQRKFKNNKEEILKNI